MPLVMAMLILHHALLVHLVNIVNLMAYLNQLETVMQVLYVLAAQKYLILLIFRKVDIFVLLAHFARTALLIKLGVMQVSIMI